MNPRNAMKPSPSPSTTEDAKRIPARCFLRSPVWLTTLLMLMVLAVLTYQMWQSRQDKIRHAESATGSLTALLEVRIANDFQRLDGLLGFAASEFSPDRLAAMPQAELAIQSPRLARLIADFPAVAGVYVFDAQGQLQLSSQLRELEITKIPF